MKGATLLFIASFLTIPSVGLSSDFPVVPSPVLTSGSLCAHPDRLRYPERIPYCDRDVTPETKGYVIRLYDERLGFHISEMDRRDFKIDHYIPLCVGGSNEVNNLWPQHKSVYVITDPMETLICGKIIHGKISQTDAIRLIQIGKNNLSQIPEIIRYLSEL